MEALMETRQALNLAQFFLRLKMEKHLSCQREALELFKALINIRQAAFM